MLEGDPTTEWHTETYDDRLMGTKRGIGLVTELSEPALMGELTIASDGTDWAASVYVSDITPSSVRQWGPALVVATGLDRHVTLRPETSDASLFDLDHRSGHGRIFISTSDP